MIIEQELSLQQKLEILSGAAKYDVACTSSGVDRAGSKDGMGNAKACGICHSFSSDGRCISLLKVLMSNECVFDCKYCINRSSNDVVRTSFEPDELVRLTMEFYRRNYIEGLFLSSGVVKNPTYTMALMYEAIYKLRNEYNFYGYIHIKTVPGADPQIIEELGFLVDRMSVNLEFPTADGLKKLAPNKTRKTILTPMKQIQNSINHATPRLLLREDSSIYGKNESIQFQSVHKDENKIVVGNTLCENIEELHISKASRSDIGKRHSSYGYKINGRASRFAPAGQSTQMIIGATEEKDYHTLVVSEALYKNYNLKRVFYSAYIPLVNDSSLPALGTKVPLLREHRLYQADWLLRFYGFQAKELLSEERPNFNEQLDPKCEWALRHLGDFPMEIMKADYYSLLRIPGIGVRSARRIVMARRTANLSFADLKKMGVVLKRAHYFITCNGKTMYPLRMDEDFITRQIVSNDRNKNWKSAGNNRFEQLSLFEKEDTPSILLPTTEDVKASVFGEL